MLSSQLLCCQQLRHQHDYLFFGQRCGCHADGDLQYEFCTGPRPKNPLAGLMSTYFDGLMDLLPNNKEVLATWLVSLSLSQARMQNPSSFSRRECVLPASSLNPLCCSDQPNAWHHQQYSLMHQQICSAPWRDRVSFKDISGVQDRFCVRTRVCACTCY